MTHIRNLPIILSEGGLWCDRQAKQRGLTQQSIGHTNIKERREKWPVGCSPGGCLCDYVPFYFHHHSPMLYVISRGGVEGYASGQDEVIYLTSSTAAVDANNLPFVFTNGHAAMALTAQYQDLDDLSKLDWVAIRATWWKNTSGDGDKERRKQAEFLVHDFMPWPLVTEIVVKTQDMAAQVSAHLQGQSHAPELKIMSAWYY